MVYVHKFGKYLCSKKKKIKLHKKISEEAYVRIPFWNSGLYILDVGYIFIKRLLIPVYVILNSSISLTLMRYFGRTDL